MSRFSHHCLASIGLVLAASALLAAPWSAHAYPRPSAVPQRWALEFAPGELRLHVDDLDGRAYWFFSFTVTNRTGQDQLFAPEFTLYTDGGEILPSGRDVPTRVEQEILELLGNEFMETQNQVIGELRQGPGNARDGLVVWPANDLEVNEISLFIAGISGDTAAVIPPGGDRPVILRKTLQRDYLVPGNALGRRRLAADLVAERWIFR
jgi:hypothetical protein